MVEGVDDTRGVAVDLHAVAHGVGHHLFLGDGTVLVGDGLRVQQPGRRVAAVGVAPCVGALEAEPARGEELGVAGARVRHHVAWLA